MKVQQLGYYAKDKNNNLFQFQWTGQEDEIFEVNKLGAWFTANPEDYEILEIGYYHNE